MAETIIENVGPLTGGKILKRENRFILKVDMGSKTSEIYLPSPGALSKVLSPGRRLLSRPANNENRKTDFTAFAIDMRNFFVTVNSSFSNKIFAEILKKSYLEEFQDHALVTKEPGLPQHGRADFLLKNENTGNKSYVEVKSCTHVENGIGKFPDRPTKRGRRHLRSLMNLAEEGFECSMVFVIQRPDADRFQPFREIDQKFSDLLKMANDNGIHIHALSTKFDPPTLSLKKRNVPIELDW